MAQPYHISIAILMLNFIVEVSSVFRSDIFTDHGIVRCNGREETHFVDDAENPLR